LRWRSCGNGAVGTPGKVPIDVVEFGTESEEVLLDADAGGYRYLLIRMRAPASRPSIVFLDDFRIFAHNRRSALLK
jgi:hypothetical protein